MGGYGDEGFML